MNRIKIHCFSKLIFVTSRKEFPLILKTIRPSFKILAFAYVFFTSFGDFQLEFIAVSNQVFKYCSDSGCDSQNSLKVLFAKIRSIRPYKNAKIQQIRNLGTSVNCYISCIHSIVLYIWSIEQFLALCRDSKWLKYRILNTLNEKNY